jgi:hypothetical protein
MTFMKYQILAAGLAITSIIAAITFVWIEFPDRTIYAQNTTGPTGFPPPESSAAGALVQNDTTSQPSSSNGNGSIFNNLMIEDAGGGFTSLQTDADNITWIATGSWDLASNPTIANQSNSSAVQFNATINLRQTDNSQGHKHEISDFKLVNRSISSGSEGSTIVLNGTATMETDVGLYSDVPISIRIIDEAPAILSIDTQTNEVEPQWIPGGGTISVLVDERVQDHFGNTPVYGDIKGD